jgi:hypothetical protein
MQLGNLGAVLFEGVEVFEEEKPGGLLDIVEFRGAAVVLAEDGVDALECLFKHDGKVTLIFLS